MAETRSKSMATRNQTSTAEAVDEQFVSKTDFQDFQTQMLEAIRNLAAQQSRTQGEGVSSSQNNQDSGTRNTNQSYAGITRLPKIDFPRFDGKNVNDWVFKVEQFFEMDNTDDETKVKLVSIHFDGIAATWHRGLTQSHSGRNICRSWNSYKAELVDRFGGVLDDPIAELKKLQETNGIVDYHDKFEMLKVRVNLPEEYLVSQYLAGLRMDTQMHIRMFMPKSTMDCLMLGKLYEQAHPLKSYGSSSYSNKNVGSNNQNRGILPYKKETEVRNNEKGRKWLTNEEIAERKAKGTSKRDYGVNNYRNTMAVEMHAGLASEGGSKLKMLLTFVDVLPTGREKGTYYALHLGGTYFRILRVHLGAQRSYLDVQDVERHPIPSHLMNSTSEVLFNFLALSLERFIEKEENGSNSQGVKRELTFTFSFPVKHTSISSAVLIKWTKGFEISDMVGKDIAECLQGALNRRGLNLHVAALVNDTVGALSLGYYHDPDTVVAVVFGSGSNACYLERTDAIIKCQGLLTTSGSMVVNIEWGNFWSSHLPRTSYDIDLDAESSNSNDMGFEKMISGMYLGDIVRRVILRMSQESDVFGPTSSVLSEPYVLSTNSFSAMHEDDTPELQEVARILKDLGVSDVPLKVRKLVVKICDVVTRRAGRLAAAGIAGILKKIGRDGSGGITSRRSGSEIQMQKRTVVAVEGGLYMNYTMFREYMEEALVEILGEEVSQYVVIKAMEDGSSIGSALLVASLQS